MKRRLLSILMLSLVALSGVIVQPVMAADDICSDGSIDEALKEAAGCNTSKTADAVVNSVLQVVTGFLALVAVCVMIFGGFTYITSTGDAAKVNKAKHIIMYGIVGLVVSLLAFVIVRFVSGAVS